MTLNILIPGREFGGGESGNISHLIKSSRGKSAFYQISWALGLAFK